MASGGRGPEMRRTDWVQCVNGPWYQNLSHGGFVAYRIWQEFDGRGWWQRHEWKHADGTTELERWIDGVPAFMARARPITD